MIGNKRGDSNDERTAQERASGRWPATRKNEKGMSARPVRARTVQALFRKTSALNQVAQALGAAGPDSNDPALFQSKAAAARREAYACSARAHAIQDDGAFDFPGEAVLQQVVEEVAAVENAIAISAPWVAVIAASDQLMATMPASSV